MALLSKVNFHLLKHFHLFIYDIDHRLFVGNIETQSEATDTISRNVALRNELDLYVNVLECKSYDGVPARHKNVNIAIVRQNTEGEYAMLEHEVLILSNFPYLFASNLNW